MLARVGLWPDLGLPVQSRRKINIVIAALSRRFIGQVLMQSSMNTVAYRFGSLSKFFRKMSTVSVFRINFIVVLECDHNEARRTVRSRVVVSSVLLYAWLLTLLVHFIAINICVVTPKKILTGSYVTYSQLPKWLGW